MAFTVVSYNRTSGGDPRPFDRFANLAALNYGHTWGGGCLEAQWALDAPAMFSDVACTPGRLIGIFDGPHRVWRGQLKEPDRGSPWTFHAEGLQACLADFLPVTASGFGAITTNPNTALTAAIARGLPVQVPAALPTPSNVDAGNTLADLLNNVGTATGKRWQVSRNGNLTMAVDPVAVDYLYVLFDTFGRTPDGYATDLFIKFNDSLTSAIQTVSAGPASTARPFGRVETLIDLTNEPAMTDSTAQAIANSARTLLGERLTFTGSLTCTRGQLLSVGGLPVALSTVRAGQVMRLVGVAPDTALGEAAYSLGVPIVMGQTAYDAVADTLQITPLQTQRGDLAGTVEDLYAWISKLSLWQLASMHLI